MCADDTTPGQVVRRVRVYNSHHKKVLTMQTVGSALTGWSPMPQKTMQMLIRTSQKLRCADKTCLSLFLNDVKLV